MTELSCDKHILLKEQIDVFYGIDPLAHRRAGQRKKHAVMKVFKNRLTMRAANMLNLFIGEIKKVFQFSPKIRTECAR
ncbi:MAG: hypothetical protein BWY75_02774 [bacterium ADurb.Bin425]|nr:MAG: hypothetical protein BWY75_02774 [bacterium ADurb.Bin425]